jgi:hypothetical protein
MVRTYIADQRYTIDKHCLNRLILGVRIQEKPVSVSLASRQQVSLESRPLGYVCFAHGQNRISLIGDKIAVIGNIIPGPGHIYEISLDGVKINSL